MLTGRWTIARPNRPPRPGRHDVHRLRGRTGSASFTIDQAMEEPDQGFALAQTARGVRKDMVKRTKVGKRQHQGGRPPSSQGVHAPGTRRLLILIALLL